MSEPDSSDANDSNNETKEQDDFVENERKNFREKISTMTFEELQKLKEEIGSKKYNETVLGVKDKIKHKKYLKRANKNRPREMSSKIPIKFPIKAIKQKKQTIRDPRFDPLCGTFDSKQFKSNYKFLKDMQKKERAKLAEELGNCEDPKQKKKIKFLLQRMDNQIREAENREKRDTEAKEEKQQLKEKLKKGEKPQFKKKSEKRIETLVNQYEELKKTNRLEKHIEKRSKKLGKKRYKNVVE